MPRHVAIAAALLALSACMTAPASGEPQPVSVGQAQSFSTLATDVIGPRCATASCHAGNPPAAYPQLDPDVAWTNLVGESGQPVQAQGAPMMLVQPGSPESSYLLLKLRGTQASAGGGGDAMPPTGSERLDDADIAAIEAWIANGAPND